MTRELSEATENLIKKYDLWQQSEQPEQGVSTIHVDEVAMRVAAFYEQLRTVIDWKEEHLMRRAAIIRKLKRRFLDLEINNFSNIEGVGEALVYELIRGGHFPNDKIKESKINDVQKIIEKYIGLLKDKSELQFYNWLIEVCSCEIEEQLSPAIKEMALIDYMFELMRERIKVNSNIKTNKDIQIYIAVQQALFKLDKPIISYNLIQNKFFSAENIYEAWQKIETELAFPLAKKFYAICEKYDTPYLLLGDILPNKNLKDPAMLESLIKSAYKKRLLNLKTKIVRAAIYSTVSIFITKILSLIILEVFLSKILIGHFNAVSLIFDVLIPTILMFTLISTARQPSEKNLSLVVLETMKIVYKREIFDTYEVKIAKKRSVATRIMLSFIYSLSAVASFGFIFWIFRIFQFPITSIVINIIFVALILFAGSAVRKRAEELTVEDEREGFLSFMSDIFFLPVQGLGKWLSSTWKQYNAIAAFFNALIDMPFSAFVEFIERWRYFLKERKEDLT